MGLVHCLNLAGVPGPLTVAMVAIEPLDPRLCEMNEQIHFVRICAKLWRILILSAGVCVDLRFCSFPRFYSVWTDLHDSDAAMDVYNASEHQYEASIHRLLLLFCGNYFNHSILTYYSAD